MKSRLSKHLSTIARAALSEAAGRVPGATFALELAKERAEEKREDRINSFVAALFDDAVSEDERRTVLEEASGRDEFLPVLKRVIEDDEDEKVVFYAQFFKNSHRVESKDQRRLLMRSLGAMTARDVTTLLEMLAAAEDVPKSPMQATDVSMRLLEDFWHSSDTLTARSMQALEFHGFIRHGATLALTELAYGMYSVLRSD